MVFRILALFASLALLAPAQALAAWHEAKTRHFVIYSEQKPEELRDYAVRLERYDSAVRAARKMADHPLSDANRLTVYVLRDQNSIEDLSGSGVAGFYRGQATGSVAFVSTERATSRVGLSPQIVFFHEYLHHLMLQEAPVAYPAWMTEGYAEFFATAKFGADGSVSFGVAPDHRGYELRNNPDALSLREMLAGTSEKMSGREYISVYSYGWLLTHYLAFEPSRRGQVTRYLQGIQQGRPAIDSAIAAFGDLKKLDRELDQYLSRKTLPIQSVPESQISTGPIALRPLAAGEAAVMRVRMRMDAGPDDGEARYIAGSARGVAAKFPGDPAVLATLAAAEHFAKRYDTALAAADRAIAANPRSLKALVYKGRALMELGKKNPAAANWPEIRKWFARANNLDPDAAEPLMLYYQSFVEQGARPPATAVEGLLYALDMAPYDRELRFMAVRQLLVDRKLGEAKSTFGPIAYSPHAGKAREKNLKIMEKIAAGDIGSAIAMLDEAAKERNKR